MEEPITTQPTTLLDQLKAKRSEIVDTKDTLIPIPGYDEDPPLLLVKYRLLEGTELEKIGQRMRKSKNVGRWDRQINAMLDQMIAACEGLYVDVAGDGEVVPLTIGGEEVNEIGRAHV